MPTDSPYSPPAEWITTGGLSILIAAAFFPWLPLFGAPGWTDVLLLLASSLFATALAQIGPPRPPVRVALAAVPIAGGALAVLSLFVPEATAAWFPRAAAVTAASVTAIRWSTGSERPGVRQGRVMGLTAIAGLPYLFGTARAALGEPGRGLMSRPGTVAFGLWFLAGSLLYMWDGQGIDQGGPSSRYFRLVGAGVLITAIFACLISPVILGAALWLMRSVLGITVDALFLLLQPAGILMERLIEAIRAALAARKQVDAPGGLPGIPEDLLERTAEYNPPAAFRVIGVILALLAIWLLANLVWRAVQSTGKRGARSGPAESSQRSTGDALGWAVDKGRKLVQEAIAVAKSFLPGGGPKDPLIRLYHRFLSIAEAAGCPRRSGQTPLEFSSVLGALLPEAACAVDLISSEFSRCFYSGTRPDTAQMARMEEELAVLKEAVRKRGLPLDHARLVT